MEFNIKLNGKVKESLYVIVSSQNKQSDDCKKK